ncbi:molybdopterin biosynthesis protein [Diplocloster modestus]|uniref:Molybdopterin molybdenumtransferase n=1 Tax=Diplocloster modestus TaxID=2850322 RepID=A0ABS6K446_9FIRM|nr:molybdopterin biosynthesis protein [Diplocloster modestus]MBU9725296.1 molybdopterin biosynthesis protein [Diplocloster modestus]
MEKRNLYLNNTPAEEAVKIYRKALEECVGVSYETIPVTEALNRVTKSAVYAKYCSPLYNSAAMDGVAVKAEITNLASEREPVELVIGENCQLIDTGDPIRPPCNAVIMAEDLVETPDPSRFRILASASPWQHVRPIGEDIVAGEMILPGGHRIRPVDIGVLIAGGVQKVEVVRRPLVAVIPTGSEIIEPGREPREGEIIESNSRMFENMVTEQEGLPFRLPPVPDDYGLLRQAILTAVREHDMVLVNAGSSAGMEDYTVHVLRELGQVIIHGVAIKPGKPVILAVVDGKPVIGLPGYPVSAFIGFQNFVIPVLDLYLGSNRQPAGRTEAVLSRRLISSLKYKEYVRVKIGKVDGKLIAAPLARGAGAAMSLVRADGFCVIDQNREGMEAGETVQVELFRSLSEIEHTVMVIGSHDLLLDVLSDLMPNLHPHMFLSSTHVGSMGGLMALRRGETHVAPIHLLDQKTGIYNRSYLEELFHEPVLLIKGVKRIQGLIVKKGNPLNIRGISDLPGRRYVNRQRGAGTRILFDYLLGENGLTPAQIDGYTHEASTHMAVAALVGSDGADAGMGIQSAAKAMDLDFLPIGAEEYDFALYPKALELPHIQAFLDVLKSQAFRMKLKEMGGYDTTGTGEQILIHGL